MSDVIGQDRLCSRVATIRSHRSFPPVGPTRMKSSSLFGRILRPRRGSSGPLFSSNVSRKRRMFSGQSVYVLGPLHLRRPHAVLAIVNGKSVQGSTYQARLNLHRHFSPGSGLLKSKEYKTSEPIQGSKRLRQLESTRELPRQLARSTKVG